MKKIILGLFLILGVVSFAAPNFVNTTKLKNDGFDIVQDEEGLFTIASSNQESALVISYYLTDKNSKELSDTIKADAPNDVKFLASLDNDQAYVNEFQNADFYSYVVVPKKQKLAKVKNAGYVIKNEREDILTMTTSDDDSAIIISFSTANISSKEISDLLKSNALRNSENFIATLDNNRAYINEFEAQGFYSYMIVPKKEKVKNQHTYATYVSSKKLSKNDLSKITNAILDEAESYIK